MVTPLPLLMPLQLSLSRESLSSDFQNSYIHQDTGDYNVTTNPGGFGTPNPERSDIYVKIFGLQYTTVNAVYTTLDTVGSYDGLLDLSRGFIVGGDSLNKFYAVPFPIVAPSGTIPVGTMWYDTVTGKVLKTIAVDSVVGATEVVTLDQYLSGEVITGDVEFIDEPILCESEIIAARKNFIYLDMKCRDKKSAREAYQLFKDHLDSAYYRWGFREYLQCAQIIAYLLQDTIPDSDCC